MLTLSLIISMGVTLLAIIALKPVAKHAGLLDIPKGRKKHDGNIPLIGGLAVFSGIAVASLISLPNEASIITWLLCTLGIVLLGVGDDAEDLSVGLRLLMQAILVLALCIGTGLPLENLGNLLGNGDIHLGLLSYPFTLLIIIGLINSFNMIDGIDGILGTVTLSALLGLVMLFHLPANAPELTLCAIFIAALIPYLLNNLSLFPFKDKIFMGDAGSMLIGFSLGWLLLEGTQDPDATAFRPVTALWLIALPAMDMARVILQRLRTGRSPFAAGRDHLHHLLLDAGLGKGATLLVMTALAMALVGIGVLGEWLGVAEYWMFYGFLLVFLGYLLAVTWLAHAGAGRLSRTFNALTQIVRKSPATPERR